MISINYMYLYLLPSLSQYYPILVLKYNDLSATLQAVQKFMKYCIDYECPLHILKYTIGKFRGAFKDNQSSLEVTRHIETRLIYDYFGLGD